MTVDKLQYPARTPATRFCAATTAALAFGLGLFSSPDYGQTKAISDKEGSIVAQASTPTPRATTEDQSIRPFKVQIPQAALDDLRRRIAATRWPDKETVADQSQGAQLAKLQELVRYWGSGYDWRKAEAKLNALPQFMTNIDGVDIHFIHVRSRHKNALPVIITHGWPGSVVEQLKVIGPLTDPTAHGGRAEDAFDVVIPSVPGYGFSGKPTGTGWDPERIAQAWAELMKRLGYTRYVAQGGDWGTPISSAMARQAASGLLGIHINLPATVPPEVAAALAGGPVPAGLSDKERAVFEALMTNGKKGNLAYFTMMTARPQTVGYGATDSPAGLAAWVLVHPGFAQWTYGADPETVAYERRRAGQHHAVLADEHRRLGSAAVLGERRTRQRHRCGRAEDRRDLAPGRHHGIPGGRLSPPRDMGPARLSQPDLLPRGRQGRTLRGVGAARALFGRAPCRVQIASGGTLIRHCDAHVLLI